MLSIRDTFIFDYVPSKRSRPVDVIVHLWPKDRWRCFLQIMTDPIALKIIITFGNLGPPSFNKDGSARPPADVAASGRSRLCALRTKLLAQITDRVMAVSTIAVRNRVHDGKQETVLLKYLLAMRRAAGWTTLCWFLSFDSRQPTRFYLLERFFRDRRGEFHFHNRQISKLPQKSIP